MRCCGLFGLDRWQWLLSTATLGLDDIESLTDEVVDSGLMKSACLLLPAGRFYLVRCDIVFDLALYSISSLFDRDRSQVGIDEEVVDYSDVLRAHLHEDCHIS